MQNSTTTPQWMNGPFELVPTPKFEEGSATPSTKDFVETASTMAVVHNCIIRGLNTIYLQAPFVQPAAYKDFIGYCHCWFEVLEGHHHGEEENLFPQIEEAVREKGIMDINIEQHRSFLPGVQEYHSYLLSVQGREHEFSGTQLCSIIDSFGISLSQHLKDEISSLLSLSKYGEKLPLASLWEEEGKASMTTMSKTGGLPFFFLNLDSTFENGLWKDWPPAPAPVKWMIRHVFTCWNSGYWKFASCDTYGTPQKLYVSCSNRNA